MHPGGLARSKRNAQPWTSGFVIAAIVVSACASAFGTGVFHALPVYASQYSTAVLADSPSDYWPADDGSGTTVSESAAVGSRNLTFNNPPSWYGSGLVSGSGSAVQGACSTCTSAWPSGVPAALPGSRSEEIWFLSPTGGAVIPQGLISVRQPENGSGGCSEGHTDVIMEPNPNIRVDSLDCFVGEFATDCNFGQNGIPNVLDKAPHLIDVTENNGVVSIYVDAKLCVTGSGANAPITSPDCVAVGAAQCVSGNGTYPITQDSVIGQAALYPSVLNITQISNHFQAASVSQPGTGSLQNAGGGNPSQHSTQCQSGHPVDCATGEFWHSAGDISVRGRGLPLTVTRTYSSLLASTDGPVGMGWTHNYNMAITPGTSGGLD